MRSATAARCIESSAARRGSGVSANAQGSRRSSARASAGGIVGVFVASALSARAKPTTTSNACMRVSELGIGRSMPATSVENGSPALDDVPSRDEAVFFGDALSADPSVHLLEARRETLHIEPDAGAQLVVEVNGEDRTRVANRADRLPGAHHIALLH